MTQFYTDFSQGVIGQQPSWAVAKRNTTVGDYTVEDIGGDKQLEFSSTTAQAAKGLGYGIECEGIVEIYAEVRDLGTNPASARLVAFATDGPDNEYGVSLNPGVNRLELYYRLNGTYKQLSTHSVTLNNAEYYKIMLRVTPGATDTLLEVKIWNPTDVEPETCQITRSDANNIPTTGGWIGHVGFAESGSVLYRAVGIGTQGQAAPREPLSNQSIGSIYIPGNLTVPELWYPGRKPTQPVKLKLDHPLARNLEAALFADPHGKPLMIDYARGISIPVDEVTGGAVIFDGSRNYPIGLSHLNGISAMSITAKAYTTDGNSNNNIVSSHTGNTSNDTFVSLRFDVSGIEGGGTRVFKASFVNQNNAATESGNNDYEVGVPITLTSRWQSGDSRVGLYANGKDIGAYNRFSVNQTQVAYQGDQMRLGMGPQKSLKGGIFFVMVHSRKLTDFEIQSLHNNPYQILVPA